MKSSLLVITMQYVFENSLFYIRAIHTILYRVCCIEYRISEVKDECKHCKTMGPISINFDDLINGSKT